LGNKIGSTNDYSVNGEETKKDQKEEKVKKSSLKIDKCFILQPAIFSHSLLLRLTLAFRRNMLLPSSRLN
jgi:hypothetical protein